jgi:hypothetical protein
VIKLTIEDLKRVQETLPKSNTEDQLRQLIAEIEGSFDTEIFSYAQKFAMTAVLAGATAGLDALELLNSVYLIGLYMGARMQEGKTEQTMTVKLEFNPH